MVASNLIQRTRLTSVKGLSFAIANASFKRVERQRSQLRERVASVIVARRASGTGCKQASGTPSRRYVRVWHLADINTEDETSPLLGVKRTSPIRSLMSHYDLKRTFPSPLLSGYTKHHSASPQEDSNLHVSLRIPRQ